MIKKLHLALLLCLATASVAGANPADYDPFMDNEHDTYSVIAAALPFPMPQEHPLNGAGRPFTIPPPAPNAEACKAVWDKGIPCPVDGKFYGYWGELQPEYCDNNYFMPDGKTLKPGAEKCECNIAMTVDMKDCPMNAHGDSAQQSVDGSTCQVYCREKDHCHCVNIWDAADNVAQPTPKSPKKVAPRRRLGA